MTCERQFDMATAKKPAKKDGKMPAFLMEKFKKGDMSDKTGRAVKRKTADVKGRAMKKGA